MPLTAETPKPLLSVGGEPILTRCLDVLVELGVEDLVVVVGYEGDQIVDAYGEQFRGVPVTYARQAERLGMAHAFLAAAEHLDGDAMLVDGDVVFDDDLSPLVERHRETGVDGTLLVERVGRAAARKKAICEVDDDGHLRSIVKEPEDPPDPAFVAAGFQTAGPELVDACRAIERSPRGEYEMAAAIQRIVDRGATVVAVPVQGEHFNVNTPADLAAARDHFG
jgi:glucose-1-phosphate thymidylyltransferase